MKRPIVSVSKESIRWTAHALPVHPVTGEISVLDGDWDLGPDADAGDAETSGRNLLPVAIARDGDILASRLSRYSVVDGQVPVRVAARHRSWQNFRHEILAYCARDGGQVYAPLTHIDLRGIPSWNDRKRALAICRSVSPASRTVLDIGAHWGYMCEELERTGRTCTALEIDPESFYFMTRLRRAQRFGYTAVLGDIFEFIDNHNNFDAVLALAVFHHFIKTEHGHDRLIELLQKLRTMEMYIWAHHVNEEQMRNAYRNYNSRDLIDWILRYSWFNSCEVIATIKFRPLLRFSHG